MLKYECLKESGRSNAVPNVQAVPRRIVGQTLYVDLTIPSPALGYRSPSMIPIRRGIFVRAITSEAESDRTTVFVLR